MIGASEVSASIVLWRRLDVFKRNGVAIDNDATHHGDVRVALEIGANARLNDRRPFAIRFDNNQRRIFLVSLTSSYFNDWHL